MLKSHMNIILPYLPSFIISSFKSHGFDSKLSSQLTKVSMRCFAYLNRMGRTDLNKEKSFDSFIESILGIYSSIISYNDSISCLCYIGHGLNSSVLLRSQLEAYLIFKYFTFPKDDIKEIKNRVNRYNDWVKVRMYINSKKSKDFDLFNLDTNLDSYLKMVEENYNYVRNKYKDNPNIMNDLEKSTSFIKEKKKLAKEFGIENLYLGVFSETSASVHIADISDRMFSIKQQGIKRYAFHIRSSKECTMISDVSNTLLVKAIEDFIEFFDYSSDIKDMIFKNAKIARKHFA